MFQRNFELEIIANSRILKKIGYRKIKGFNRYMIRDGVVINIVRMYVMSVRKDGRINLTKNDGKRTCVFVNNLRRVK